jgi:hypothetical protein
MIAEQCLRAEDLAHRHGGADIGGLPAADHEGGEDRRGEVAAGREAASLHPQQRDQ